MENSNARKLKFTEWMLLLAIGLIYYFSNMQKVLVPGATFNELQQMFGIDASKVALLGSFFMYVYAFMQLVTGPLADRFGGAKVILFGSILFCIGSLVSSCRTSFATLCLCRALTGFGAATIYLSAVKELDRLVPQSLPIFAGLLTLIGYSGSMTGTTPFILGVHKFGYSAMMGAAAIGVTAVYLLYIVIYNMTKVKAQAGNGGFAWDAYPNMFRIRNNYCQMFNMGLAFGTYFALQSVIGKKYLEDFCGVSSVFASNVLFAMMLIATVNAFLVAVISKLCGDRHLIFLRLSGFGAALASLSLFAVTALGLRGPWLSIVPMLLMAVFCNVSSMSTAMFRENNSDRQFGTIMSISNGFAYLVTASVGGSIGKLMDCYEHTVVDGVNIYGSKSYMLVFGLMAVLGCLSAVFSLGLREKTR